MMYSLKLQSKKLKGLYRLLRFELPLAAGICVVMGQLFALSDFAPPFTVAAGFLSVFLISSSILVLNDFFDVETDRINSPDRPSPSNIISANEALIFSLCLAIGGLLISYFIDRTALIICGFLFLTGYLYNRYFKKSGIFGNLIVSFSVGMTFIYGGATVGFPFHNIVVFFAIIAALIDLGEEIAADAMDVKGDLVIKSKSLAIKYGKRFALKVSISIFLLVIIISLLPFFLSWFRPIYLVPIIIMDVSIALPALKLFNSTEQKGRRYIRHIYLGSTFGLIIFLIMKVYIE